MHPFTIHNICAYRTTLLSVGVGSSGSDILGPRVERLLLFVVFHNSLPLFEWKPLCT